MSIFTDAVLIAGANLQVYRTNKGHWGRALVRTDLTNSDVSFLEKSFKKCVEKEKEWKVKLKDAKIIANNV